MSLKELYGVGVYSVEKGFSNKSGIIGPGCNGVLGVGIDGVSLHCLVKADLYTFFQIHIFAQ